MVFGGEMIVMMDLEIDVGVYRVLSFGKLIA